LADKDWEDAFSRLIVSEVTPRKTISPLFAALYSTSRIVRWHAVSCFGIAVPKLSESGLEQARIVVRRCTWSLNDESGGIGWGAPEAIAEILAALPEIAEEYVNILISFILEREQADNFLEYLPLREGAYWGIARLAQARPDLVQPWQEHILHAISRESSPFILGSACLILSCAELVSDRSKQLLRHIEARPESISLYWNREFWLVTLSELAQNGASFPTDAAPEASAD